MEACSLCQENILKPRVELDFTSLHEILRSESGPASVQLDKINLILERLQQDLEDLESSGIGIDAHESCISKYTAETRSLLSPIRKIPDEILQAIFEYCCDMNHFVVSAPSETAICNIRNKPAMVLSSTCFRWRRNALHMPSLWSSITLEWDWLIYGFKKDDAEDEKRSFTLASFLSHSLQWPLAVNLIFKGAAPNFYLDGTLHPIAAQVVEQRHRWKSLSFKSAFSFVEELFPEDHTPQFPLLENLSLLHSADDLDIFQDIVPNLKALKMPYAFPFRRGERFPFPQLLHLEPSSDEDVLDVLDHTPNLASLVIGECLEGEPARDSPCLTSSSLRTLTICHGNRKLSLEVQFSVFPLFNFSLLDALHLQPAEHFNLQPGFWFNFDLCMAFLQRSSCPLTTLSIKRLSLSDSNLVRLLRQVPTLRNLTITDTDIGYAFNPITEQLIESLNASQISSLRTQAEPLIPRLHSLTLDSGAIAFRDSVLIDMVCSRWIPFAGAPASGVSNSTETDLPSVDCLREFTMKFRNRQNPGDVYGPLEVIEKSGMRLVVIWEK
ncbi:hypothetical protein GYMLUDRAFT_41117 [Collybiopsis luxurians FD-317 M1]|uniref:F-box domain-containing protein n=1 Tax=Collybiopsis luxurians FD-317 M1 TaxID=944289 RepID=A0A0D0D2J7_9AGAR|nr:hypothetical protein GYMLUDRAFT_41117 [Collybiopsis luxurians FD-317 M1]